MKQKPITLKEYNKRMDKIIKVSKYLGIDKTFIKLIEEAGKWKIKEGKR